MSAFSYYLNSDSANIACEISACLGDTWSTTTFKDGKVENGPDSLFWEILCPNQWGITVQLKLSDLSISVYVCNWQTEDKQIDYKGIPILSKNRKIQKLAAVAMCSGYNMTIEEY